VKDRASAQKARFERAVELGIGETLLPHFGERSLQGFHLGMRQGRPQLLDAVAADAYNLAVNDDNRTDWHLVIGSRFARKFEAACNPAFVFACRGRLWHLSSPVHPREEP
jgi:hypothetical protein